MAQSTAGGDALSRIGEAQRRPGDQDAFEAAVAAATAARMQGDAETAETVRWRLVELAMRTGPQLLALAAGLRHDILDDPAEHWAAICIRRSALELLTDDLEALRPEDRLDVFDRSHLDLLDGLLRRLLDTVPAPPPEGVPPGLPLGHWWWRRPAGPTDPSLLLPAILAQLEEAAGADGETNALLRALESLLDLWRGPTRPELPREELTRFLAEADDALAGASHLVRGYFEEGLAMAIRPDGVNEWHEACLRRSVLQVLVDHHRELPGSVAEFDLFDTRLREAGNHLGPLHHDDVPAGLPEHHWWWRAAPLPGALAPPPELWERLHGLPAGIWELEVDEEHSEVDWFTPLRDALPWLTPTAVTTEHRRWTRAGRRRLTEWLGLPDPSTTLSVELAANLAWGEDAIEVVLAQAAELRFEDTVRLILRPDVFTSETPERAAERNRRRLGESLRQWERASNGKIVAWYGCRPSTQRCVDRHGFRSPT